MSECGFSWALEVGVPLRSSLVVHLLSIKLQDCLVLSPLAVKNLNHINLISLEEFLADIKSSKRFLNHVPGE